MLFLVLLINSAFSNQLATCELRQVKEPGENAKHVELKIDFGIEGSEKIEIKKINWSKKMTVLQLMNKVSKDRGDKFNFKYVGKNSTAFLKSIQSVANEGGRGSNWIYFINDKLGDKSFGSKELKPGDKVTWKFQKYRFEKKKK